MISTTVRKVRAGWVLAAIMIVSFGAIVFAMRRTSTTFDEIVLMAGGARGYHTGNFDLAPEHPPLMQYIYGLPIILSRPSFPSDNGDDKNSGFYRYAYSRQFFWKSGNDPYRLAFLGRLPAALLAMGLVFASFAFTRARVGEGAALLAAMLTAFMPDVLAHGGVAYNDVPAAFTIFLALWAVDTAVRLPSMRSGIVAGVAIGIAFGVKVSAVAIAPAAFLLLAFEGIARGRDSEWFPRARRATAVAITAFYLTLVIIYRGDFALSGFSHALSSTLRHVAAGHDGAAYILGKSNLQGFWYFYPVAFLFKTPAALQILLLIALGGIAGSARKPVRELCASSLRLPLVILIVFGTILLTSKLDIGFRYAMPLLPPLCILIATGVTMIWRKARQTVRVIIASLLAWAVLSSVTYYPNFLAYVSEYGPGRGHGSDVLVDSSLDWGQGMIQLRDYMRTHHIERVYLSYFGSALPEGYGVDYEPLESFFALRPSQSSQRGAAKPTHIAISATNLRGVYLKGDPFRKFREREPQAVVAHTIYVYAIQGKL